MFWPTFKKHDPLVEDAINEADFVAKMITDINGENFEVISAIDFLLPKLKKSINMYSGDIKKRYNEGMSLRCIIFQAILNLAYAELFCGEHMIYRGVPNMTGGGLIFIHSLACEVLTSCGVHDQNTGDKLHLEVLNMIKERG
jgi:hypothetical protein